MPIARPTLYPCCAPLSHCVPRPCCAGKERDEELPKGFSFMVFWTISLGYALAAAVPVVLIEAASNSSGIPEVKMILNGVKMPRITRFKTLLCRIWGNIFSVSSGLPGMCALRAACAVGVCGIPSCLFYTHASSACVDELASHMQLATRGP